MRRLVGVWQKRWAAKGLLESRLLRNLITNYDNEARFTTWDEVSSCMKIVEGKQTKDYNLVSRKWLKNYAEFG